MKFNIEDYQQSKLAKLEDLTKYFGRDVKVNYNPNSTTKRYTINGEIVPGVTSILRIINKPSLIQWAADMASKYWRDNYTTVAENSALYENGRKAYLTKSEAATDLGSLVHWATEVYDRTGEVIEFEDEVAAGMLARYINWRLETGWKVLFIEQIVASVNNTICKYAGTIDRLFEMPNGKLAVIDFKTSKVSAFSQKGVYEDYPLQNAAYIIALEEMGFKIDCTGWVNPDKEHGILQVHMLDESALQNAKQSWLACLHFWQLFNKTKYFNKAQNSLPTRAWYATHKI